MIVHSYWKNPKMVITDKYLLNLQTIVDITLFIKNLDVLFLNMKQLKFIIKNLVGHLMMHYM